ncbi:hypothetical protein A4H34_06275 [Peptidiphaga gingivicola]|uniref:Uncharacterized protein n=1 Tax=Peptidiphaga gingivicola TaxID=2741497 RepID=A0A179B4U5_9ACTO|nr:hypothetical protein A4H34_06275 [Peptidiphaga gingivicola]
MASYSDADRKTQPDADHTPHSCAERRMPFGVDRKAQPDSGNGRDFRHPSKPPCLILKHAESPAGTHLAAGESVATCTGARITAVHNSDTADTDIKTTTETHAGIHTGTAGDVSLVGPPVAPHAGIHTGTADAKPSTRTGTADAKPSTRTGTADAKPSTRTGTADAKPGDVGASPNQMAHPALSGSIGLLGGMPRPQPSGDDRRKTRAPKNGKLECRRTERPYEEDR